MSKPVHGNVLGSLHHLIKGQLFVCAGTYMMYYVRSQVHHVRICLFLENVTELR